MKIAYLKQIKKYWDYRFHDGKVITRNKVNGEVREYDSIYQFINWFFSECASTCEIIRWEKKKKSIRDKKKWSLYN